MHNSLHSLRGLVVLIAYVFSTMLGQRSAACEDPISFTITGWDYTGGIAAEYDGTWIQAGVVGARMSYTNTEHTSGLRLVYNECCGGAYWQQDAGPTPFPMSWGGAGSCYGVDHDAWRVRQHDGDYPPTGAVLAAPVPTFGGEPGEQATTNNYWTSNAVTVVTNMITVIATNTEEILAALLYETEEGHYYNAQLLYNVWVACGDIAVEVNDVQTEITDLRNDLWLGVDAIVTALGELQSSGYALNISLSNMLSQLSTSINSIDESAANISSAVTSSGYDGIIGGEGVAMRIQNPRDGWGNTIALDVDQSSQIRANGGWIVKQGPRDTLADNWYVHVKAFDPSIILKAEVVGVGGGAMVVQISNLVVNVGGSVAISNELLWVGQHSTSNPWRVTNIDPRVSVTNALYVNQHSNSNPWVVTNLGEITVRQSLVSTPWIVSTTGDVKVARMDDLIAAMSNGWGSVSDSGSYSNHEWGHDFSTNIYFQAYSNMDQAFTNVAREFASLTNTPVIGLQDTNKTWLQGWFTFSPPSVQTNPVIEGEMLDTHVVMDASQGNLGGMVGNMRAMFGYMVIAGTFVIMVAIVVAHGSRVGAS